MGKNEAGIDIFIDSSNNQSGKTKAVLTAYQQAGMCLGETIAKLVFIEADEKYKSKEIGYRTGVSPKIFTVETLKVSNIGIIQIHGESAVAFNNDSSLIFTPNSLIDLKNNKTFSPITLAEEIIDGVESSKYFLRLEDAIDVANKLNDLSIQRMKQVSTECLKYVEIIAKAKSSNFGLVKGLLTKHELNF